MEFTIKPYKPKYKSQICISGQQGVFLEKKFNKLQKAMWKMLLGVEIIDVNNEDEGR